MKFTCNQQSLTKSITTVMKAVSSRTTIPVLKGILIEAREDGKILFTSSDLEKSIKVLIDADVEEAGSAVVVAKLFSDIIRKLPNEDIQISTNEDNTVNIKTSYSEFKVVSLAVDEFPKVGDMEENSEKIVFDKNIFKDMVRKTSFAASIEEAKGVYTGILTEINDDNITMVSLDGFRLAIVKEKVSSDKTHQFIISAKIMNEISKIVSEDDNADQIEMYLGEKKTLFSIGNTDIILRIMEGEYPRYKDIVPKDSTTSVVIGKTIFLDSIERASLLAKEGKNNLIKISIKNDLMTITSRSEEGNVKEEIIVEKEGNDIEIGFNSKYVMDVLKVLDEEEILLNFKTGISPCLVEPVEGDEFKYLILPVRIPSV